MTAPKGAATPKRPPLARKHTPQTEANRTAGLDEGVRITFQGQVYEVRGGDLSAIDVRDLRKATGMSYRGLLQNLYQDADIDLIAALVWLARRARGEGIPYEMVANEFTYLSSDDVQIEGTEGPEEVDGNPEG